MGREPRTGSALIGRADESAVLATVLENGRTASQPGYPRPVAMMVSGVEGIGKTRLARHAVLVSRDLGFDTAWVAATRAAAGIPFGAFAHMLPTVPVTDRVQLVRTVAHRLSPEVGDRPTLLVVDDAHLLDAGSAALVHHLVVSGSAVVLTTVRSDVDRPEALTSLWKDGLSERLDLGPLGAADTAALAAADLGGPLDAVTLRRVSELAQGNPLYLLELLRAGRRGGRLTPRDGVWTWRGGVLPAPRLIELLGHRLGGQPGPVQDLVDLVALAEPVDLALLERAGVDPAEVAAAEAAGLLGSAANGDRIDVRLAHPLVGEVARARARPLHRRLLSARLARAADEPGTPDGPAAPVDDLRSAVWHLDGGLPMDPHRLLRVAAQALAVLDLPLAVRLAGAAVTAGAGPVGEVLLAVAQVHAGEVAGAEDVLAGLGGPGLPDQLRAQAVALRAWTLVFAHGRHTEAVALLADLDAAGPHTRDQRDLVLAQLANLAGDVTPAATLAAGVVGRPGATAEATAQGLAIGGQADAVRGRYDDAAALADRALGLAGRMGGWSMLEEESRGGLALAQLGAGRLAAARTVVDRGRERSIVAGWHTGAAVWAGWSGEIDLARGRVRTALGQFREACAVLLACRHPYREWVSRIVLLDVVRAAALAGRPDEAAAAAARFAALSRPWTRLLETRDGGAAAWVELARGDVGRAVDATIATADTAADRDQAGWELSARHLAVRWGAADRVCDRVLRLGAVVDGPLPAAQIEHTLAAAGRDAAGLEAAATLFAGLDHQLLAAEAWAQASVVHRGRGRVADATRTAATARSVAAGCEGARSPALVALGEPSALTRRETEIARLAAGGRSNRDIAAGLVISVRTVDNTLHQVYAKLGLTGRRELQPVFVGAEPSGPGPAGE